MLLLRAQAKPKMLNACELVHPFILQMVELVALRRVASEMVAARPFPPLWTRCNELRCTPSDLYFFNCGGTGENIFSVSPSALAPPE